MRLPYLEGLRGYMAIWVVLIHAIGFTPYDFSGIPTSGSLPVAVFILLSGFVTHILLTKGEPYGQYLKRRALRLFPVYLVTFIISLAMLDFTYDVMKNLFIQNDRNIIRLGLIEQAYNSNMVLNVLSHLTLTHGLFPNQIFPFTYTIMGQSWSLTLEWQFYIVIPFIFKLIQQPIDRKKLIIFGGLTLILMAASKLLVPQASFLPNMLHFFLIGFFSYPLYKKYVNEGSNTLFIFIGIATLAVSVLNYQYLVVMALWAMVLWMQKTNNPIGDAIFNNKVSQYIGKISYSIYCVHMIVLMLLIYFTQQIGFVSAPDYSLFIMVGGVFVTILVSMLTYKFIEEPFIRLGKKKKIESVTPKLNVV